MTFLIGTYNERYKALRRGKHSSIVSQKVDRSEIQEAVAGEEVTNSVTHGI